MRMILIHGINQEEKSSVIIRDQWVSTLNETYAKCRDGDSPLGGLKRIDAAFYGDLLAKFAAAGVTDEAIALGNDERSDGLAEFGTAALEQMAARIGVTEQQIQAELGPQAIAHGAGYNKAWIKAIARAIERVSPWKGTLALRLITQAHAYIRNQTVHDAVNAAVAPLFEDDEPAIVVSHSLGTIVAYSLLREFADEDHNRPRHSPLLVTLGSPLGIDSVYTAFTPPRTRPPDVVRWVNAADPDDFVALRPELTSDMYSGVDRNIPDCHNGPKSHSIVGYLGNQDVAEEIAAAIPHG